VISTGEQHALTRTDHARQLAVQIHDGHLRVGRLHDGEQPRGRLVLDHESRPVALELHFVDGAALGLDPEAVHHVLARLENGVKAALAEQQDPLAVTNQNA